MDLKTRLIREWKTHRSRFFFLLFITLLSALLRTAIPYFYKLIIDQLSDSKAISDIGPYVTMIIIIGVSRFIVYAYFQSNRAMMNMRFEWEMRARSFATLMKAGKLQFRSFSTGEILTRLTDDAEKLSWFLSSGVFRGLDAILIFSISMYFLVILNPILTLYTLLPVTMVIGFMIFSKRMFRRAYTLLQTKISDMNDYIYSSFSGISILKSYNREWHATSFFKKMLKERKTCEMRAVSLRAANDVFNMGVNGLSMFLVLSIGGAMVIKGTMTLGAFVAFIAYMANLIHPIRDIGVLFVRGREAQVSSNRIGELEAIRTDESSGTKNASFTCEIRCENIGFAIDGEEILHDISLTVKRGEKIAIMGKIGSGKTFLTKVLAGIIAPTRGKISIDDISLAQCDIAAFRAITGYASQHAIIFSDTIQNNIILNGEKDEARFAKALQVSQFSDEMDKFGLGLETVVGPKGKTLSGGQKQRLALARALYHKPDILILDDVTSALDAETEMHLWHDLFAETPDQTLIVVTHRPKIAEIVDTVYILDGGRIVEFGSHDVLRANNALYAEIYHEK